MGRKAKKDYVADFETVVFDGQEYTEVWAAALTEVGNTDIGTVDVTNSLPRFLGLVLERGAEIVYFHNLRFDGAFLVNYLSRNGWTWTENDRKKVLEYKTYTTVITERGVWYEIKANIFGHIVEFRDSLKLLPLSVSEIGRTFNTIHRKTEIEYTGVRHAGGIISAEETEYIKNDVLVVSEALGKLFEMSGTKRPTIGSQAYYNFLHGYSQFWRTELFPPLEDVQLDSDIYGAENAEQYIRRAYRGGWCYVDPRIQGQEVGSGVVYDVNSLYPYVMHSESGNAYPVGLPTFWRGAKPDEADRYNNYYYIRFRARFMLRRGYVPTLQIKGNWLYNPREYLTTSDVKDRRTGRVSPYYIDVDGTRKISRPVLTMSRTDFELFTRHYAIIEFEPLDGCYFRTEQGLFDAYIDYWRRIKEESTGGKRQIAKLYLNNLYGKFASSSRSDYKIPDTDETGKNVFISSGVRNERKPAYIAIGAAITAYARAYTIAGAQANYNRFCYADTDSLHLIGTGLPADIPVDQKRLGAFKHESTFARAKFLRPKTYCEVDEYGVPHFTAAGCPRRSKEILAERWGRGELGLDGFAVGLTVGGKLVPQQIRGGVILVERDFTIL